MQIKINLSESCLESRGSKEGLIGYVKYALTNISVISLDTACLYVVGESRGPTCSSAARTWIYALHFWQVAFDRVV